MEGAEEALARALQMRETIRGAGDDNEDSTATASTKGSSSSSAAQLALLSSKNTISFLGTASAIPSKVGELFYAFHPVCVL